MTGIIEGVAISLAPDVVRKAGQIISRVVDDWQTGRRMRKGEGIALNYAGYQQYMPARSGILPISDFELYQAPYAGSPILLTGEFLADESVAVLSEILLDYEDQLVLVLVVDDETGDIYIGEFDFDGYSLSLWEGTYYFYAFIIDPYDEELLGFGYLGDVSDPNPITITGEGVLELDFVLLDALDFY